MVKVERISARLFLSRSVRGSGDNYFAGDDETLPCCFNKPYHVRRNWKLSHAAVNGDSAATTAGENDSGDSTPSGKSVECLIVARIHGVSGCIANELSGYSAGRGSPRKSM